jgi:leucyl/phenylalanyl-tRNA--protein transferase
MRILYRIPPHADPEDFPPLEKALNHPDGLLAMGGDLQPKRLIAAYQKGIFPWYNDNQPILWWSPSQRMVLFPEHLKISDSLRKTIRKKIFTVTLDQDFRAVIQGCAAPRSYEPNTWITDEMVEAYCRLHELGFAHSVESWYEGELVGGLYGVALGKIFFGESMFTRISDASKVAFVHFVKQLQAWGFELIDCQMQTAHLQRFGAITIPREDFFKLLNFLYPVEGYTGEWRFESIESQ